MYSILDLAEVGALVGDPGRANMLSALLGGRALTAAELASIAGVTAPTASEHLKKLTAARLLICTRQGRHRYFRMASPDVAHMLEGMMTVAASNGAQRYRPASRIDAALRAARICYDHLAGGLGVGLADALCGRGYVSLSEDAGEVTATGSDFFRSLGIDLSPASDKSRRPVCRVCIDWTERRPHLAGTLGMAICRHCLASGWIERESASRAVRLTPPGRAAFARLFGLECTAPQRHQMPRDATASRRPALNG